MMNEKNKKQEEKKKEKAEEGKSEKEIPEKEEVKKAEEKKIDAVVRGSDIPASTKHAIAICNSIRGKTIEKAVIFLEEVLKMKKAVPMKGELPHRRGKGIERGRYPIKATAEFIKLLKQLSANAIANGIDIENLKIECKADRANRPYRRFGSRKFKRTHITLRISIKPKKK